MLAAKKSISAFPSGSNKVAFVGLVFSASWNCLETQVADLSMAREKCVDQLVAGMDSCGKGTPTYGFVSALYGLLSLLMYQPLTRDIGGVFCGMSALRPRFSLGVGLGEAGGQKWGLLSLMRQEYVRELRRSQQRICMYYKMKICNINRNPEAAPESLRPIIQSLKPSPPFSLSFLESFKPDASLAR